MPDMWEKYRRKDRTIDLKKAYINQYSPNDCGKDYIDEIEALQLIKSRQLAAMIIVQASYIGGV